MALWKAPKRLINGFYNRSFKIRSKWGQSRLLGCVECWVDCFILYTAAVAALHLFIPSSHQQSKPRDATPSPTLRPPRSFHHSMEMETRQARRRCELFSGLLTDHNRMSAYIGLSCCGLVGRSEVCNKVTADVGTVSGMLARWHEYRILSDTFVSDK